MASKVSEVPYPGITPWLAIRRKINEIIDGTLKNSGYSADDIGKSFRVKSDGTVEMYTPTDNDTQANWNEADTDSPAYIQNKPTIPSGNDLVPSTTGATQGDVLTVGASGPEWAAPSGGATTKHYTSNVDLVAAMIALDVGTEISLYGSYVQNPGGQYEAAKSFYVSRAHKIASDDYLASGGYKATNWTGVYELQTNVSTNGLGFIEASGGSDWMNDNYHPGSVDVYLTVYE